MQLFHNSLHGPKMPKIRGRDHINIPAKLSQAESILVSLISQQHVVIAS